jgi:outer membrane receptor protein involved in Fe transport
MSSLQRRFIRAALVCSGSISLFGPAFAVAAEETAAKDSGDQIETIVITGSRIARRDYEANSPILTVDESLLKNSGTAAIETNLTKLPQFHAVQTPAQGGDIQPTATNTPGAATISLRGLGTNRSLILLDGRRATPGNASQVVDINTIPSLAIESVETITGGASATYGADAVTGVVNFKLRKKFEGVQFDAQMGESSRSDGREYQYGGIMGANLADGRGNVMLAFSVNDRGKALHVDRPWFEAVDRSPNTAGNDVEYFPTFSGYDPFVTRENIFNIPGQATMDALFPGQPAGTISNFRYYFNADGTPFVGFFQSTAQGGAGTENFKGDLTGTKWVQTADGQLKQSFQDALAVLPLHRDNFMTRGNYEINDWLNFSAQGMFSNVETHTVQQPSPAVNGWGAFIEMVDRNGDPIQRTLPAPLAAMLASRPTPNGTWKLVQYLDNILGNRQSTVDVMTYNLQGGFDGKIPGTDWTWEAYASGGQSETTSTLTGVASLERYRTVVNAPNWGAGWSSQGNPLFGGFGASTATCTSGIDPFNKDPNFQVSEDCKEAISADLKNRAVLRQQVQEINAQGKAFTLPAGEVRVAVGASHRESTYLFLNDTLTTQGRSFNDQSIGIYPSGNSGGKITVKEFYAEALVPLLADLPAVRKLELELGARSSDYNTTGRSTTWKAMVNWDTSKFLRFRGGFNRAERSPNIAELYLAPQQTFVFNSAGDLCSFSNPSKYSANPANWAGGAANPTAQDPAVNKAYGLCRALMDRWPGTAALFYAPGNDTYWNSVGGAFAFPTQQGNPNVKPEKADTYTFGLVFDSPFDGALTRQMRLSLDYYNVKVTDALGPQSVDMAQRQCFDPAFNPTYDVNSVYCKGINRVANDGALGNIITTYFNNGRFTTSGVDLQFDWGFDAGPGHVSINSIISYLISLKSSELASDPTLEYAGTLGPNQNGLNPGAFRWKMFNTFGYHIGKWNASLQWQHLPSADSASKPGNDAVDRPTPTTGVGSYDVFALTGSFAVLKGTEIRFGVDNLFDKAPPMIEVNQAPPSGVLAGGRIDDINYDVNGRRFYLGATVKL